MSKQPEALRLADELYVGDFDFMTNHEAAEELRRLYALCEEMGEAHEKLLKLVQSVFKVQGWDSGEYVEVAVSQAALAKWKESK